MTNRPRTAFLGLALASLLLHACTVGAALSAAPASDPARTPSRAPSPAPSIAKSASATTSATASPSPSAEIPVELIGEWSSPHRCAHIVEILTANGYAAAVLEAVVGNGLIPGVTSVDDVADAADPCAGAVDVPHSHSFSADGRFASFDGKHEQVDDGGYRMVDADTLVINGTSFTYMIDGDALTLTPDIPDDCKTRDCGFEWQWATMVALPGQVWERVRP